MPQSVTPITTRHVLISDAQLQLLARCAEYALAGRGRELTAEERYEAAVLVDLITDATSGKHAPDVLHGFTL
jgi:hypothetical protein